MRAVMYHKIGEGRYAVSSESFEKHISANSFHKCKVKFRRLIVAMIDDQLIGGNLYQFTKGNLPGIVVYPE